MLILSRHARQEIVIGEGDNQVVLTVVEIRGNKVRLGLTGPANIGIHRREVYEAIQREKGVSDDARDPEVPRL